MTVQERIRETRKSQGLTQKELAKRMGVTQSMVGQYETNQRPPKIDTIQKIADALGVDADYLQTGKTTAQSDAEYIKEKRQSMEETKAINALFVAHGYKYEKIEVEGELPYRYPVRITAPDGTEVELTHEGQFAYSATVNKEILQFLDFVHERTAKDLAEADEARETDEK